MDRRPDLCHLDLAARTAPIRTEQFRLPGDVAAKREPGRLRVRNRAA
jgi:hypothetical protein